MLLRYDFFAPCEGLNCLLLLQAIEELNLKTKNFKDLLTIEAFTKKDIITLQVKYYIAHFYYTCLNNQDDVTISGVSRDILIPVYSMVCQTVVFNLVLMFRKKDLLLSAINSFLHCRF